MKNQNHRYNINDITRETYYQLPKVFFTKHSKYENLSLSASVAFSFLKDRFNYSIKNNWVDENGDIFFIFTNAELGEALKVKSNATVVKIKKELEKFGLLEQQRMGFKQPNRLYLLQPEVTAKDVYELQETTEKDAKSLVPQGSLKIKLHKKDAKSLAPQGSLKIKLHKKAPQTLAPQGSLKIKHDQYKEQEDTKKIHTDTQLDFSKHNYSSSQIENQNADLVNHFDELLDNKALPKFLNTEASTLIKSWCQTPAEVYRFVQIILNAKKSVANDMAANGFEEYIDVLELENLQSEISTWLRNYFNRIRSVENTKHKINDYESYLYSTMAHNLNSYVHDRLQKSDVSK